MLGIGLKAELRDRCLRIREHLSARSAASDEEIKDVWPGGELNPKRDTLAWARCYADLSRIVGRSESNARETTADQDEAAVIDALTDQPADLVITKPDGSPMAVSVYPKSHRALEWFRARSKRIAWLVVKRDAIEQRQDVSALPLMERVGEEIAFQYCLLADAATTTGPWLPWEPMDVPNVAPDWAAFISPQDLLRIWNAFLEVNAVRLAIVQRRLSPSGSLDEKPLSWAEFFALRSSDTGVATSTLLRDRSLVSEIASALKASDVRARTAA